MKIPDFGKKIQIHPRISGYAAMVMRDQQRKFGTPGALASESEITEIALGLLELIDAGGKFDRARTLLWNALTNAAREADIAALKSGMAQHRARRSRKSRTPGLPLE